MAYPSGEVIPMNPKERAVQTAMASIEKAVRKALDAVLPQVMSDLFDAGGAEYANALQRAMHSVSTDHLVPRSLIGAATSIQPASQKGHAKQSKDGRAPRGSVRRAVLSVLLPNPNGLSASEVVSRAQQVDPSISVGGIQNELNRQKGIIYRNEGGVWWVPPELKLGGDYYDLNELRVSIAGPPQGSEVSE